MERAKFIGLLTCLTLLLPAVITGCGGGNDNAAPVANPGSNINALVAETVTLDGRSSNDPDGDPITYNWTFVSVPQGSSVTLLDSSTATPTFIVDKEGAYVVSLVVSDELRNSPASTVTVTGYRCQIGTTWDGSSCSDSRTMAYFRLENTLADTTGKWTGTLGSGTYVTGKDGQGLQGPSACSYVYAARVDGFPNLPDSFTVEAFIRPACPPNSWQGNLTVAKWDNGYTGPGFVLFSTPDPYSSSTYRFSFHLSDGLSSKTAISAVTNACGNWYHVAGVREKGNALRLFVNGIEVGSAVDTVGSIANTRSLTFSGHTPEAGGCGWGMSQVDMDDIAIYSKALNPLEIAGHASQYQ